METTKNISQQVISPWIAVGLPTLPNNKVITYDKAFYFIEKVTGCTKQDLRSRARKREFVDARKLFCIIMRKEAKKSTTEIGYTLRKDHSTVVHATATGEDLLTVDKAFKKQYNVLLELINNPFSEYERVCDAAYNQ